MSERVTTPEQPQPDAVVVLNREVHGIKLKDYEPGQLGDVQLAHVLTAYWSMPEVRALSTQLLPATEEKYSEWLHRLNAAVQPLVLTDAARTHLFRDVTVNRLLDAQARLPRQEDERDPQQQKLQVLSRALTNLRIRELVALTSIDKKPYPHTITLPTGRHWVAAREKLLDEIDPNWRHTDRQYDDFYGVDTYYPYE